MIDLRVISLGAGVQSTVMYIMAAMDSFDHKPDAAIFADTQAEPPWVYEHLGWLEKQYGHLIPIERCSNGSLEKNLYWGGEGRRGFAQIPAFLKHPNTGERGISRRQCTYEFKIRPIERRIREMLGLSKGQRAAGKYRVEQWMGISVDEAHRAKPSDTTWIERRYPLLFDVPMRRWDCLRFAEALGIHLRKSACYFCPYHRDAEWLYLKQNAPDLFRRAVEIDEDLRSGRMRASKDLRGEQYLHDSLRPLSEVDLDTNRDQPDLFGNECEGMCGV